MPVVDGELVTAVKEASIHFWCFSCIVINKNINGTKSSVDLFSEDTTRLSQGKCNQVVGKT